MHPSPVIAKLSEHPLDISPLLLRNHNKQSRPCRDIIIELNVEEGDTLEKLAETYQIPFEKLLAANEGVLGLLASKNALNSWIPLFLRAISYSSSHLRNKSLASGQAAQSSTSSYLLLQQWQVAQATTFALLLPVPWCSVS